jgi:hypothetical protein
MSSAGYEKLATELPQVYNFINYTMYLYYASAGLCIIGFMCASATTRKCLKFLDICLFILFIIVAINGMVVCWDGQLRALVDSDPEFYRGIMRVV